MNTTSEVDYGSLTCVHTWKADAYKKGTQLPQSSKLCTFNLVLMAFLTFSKHLVQKLIDDFIFLSFGCDLPEKKSCP